MKEGRNRDYFKVMKEEVKNLLIEMKKAHSCITCWSLERGEMARMKKENMELKEELSKLRNELSFKADSNA